MSQLSREQQTRIIGALVEGCSIRSVERLTDAHRDSIMRLGVRIGEGCARLHDEKMRDLQCSTLELDEAWSFVQKKQKRTTATDPAEYGDSYTWIAIDANRKAIVSYRVGKRSAVDARAFLADLRKRVVSRPQLTSDGYAPYIDAIDRAFGDDCDYAQIVKDYATTPGNEAAVRYSPGSIIRSERTVITGTPDPTKISTSYVERQNLTLRMQMRRFTRLTNGFSKKIENHRAAVALHVAWYNFCRVHETLRMTPAMALGVTDHIWSVGELVDAALAQPAGMPTEPTPGPIRRTHHRGEGLPADRRPFKLTVIDGGKIGKRHWGPKRKKPGTIS
jgi:IS1 family transposase